MKIANLSLILVILVAMLSLFQFNRYQQFTYHTQQALKALETTVDQKYQAVDALLKNVQDQSALLLKHTQSDAIRLAEAEAYIHLAEAKLQTSQDVSAALYLLQLALSQLTPLQNPAILSLKQALTIDIRALEATVLPDLSALWSTVNQLIKISEGLEPRVIKTPDHQQANHQALLQKVPLKDWRTALKLSWEQIKELIKIRRITQPIEPLLEETQLSLVKENLRSMLEQARLALVATDDSIFQGSIENAENWLSRYYDLQLEECKHVQQGLQSLKGIELRPSLPPLTASEHLKGLR